MDAQEARELANKNGFEEKVEKRMKDIEERVRSACEYGRTRTCAFAFCNDNDKTSVDLEVKKRLLKKGYSFRRTPVNGGVPQDTEDICW